MIMTNRRKLIGGLASLIAAPAIIRVADLMRISPVPEWGATPPSTINEATEAIMVAAFANRLYFSKGPQYISWSAIENPTDWTA